MFLGTIIVATWPLQNISLFQAPAHLQTLRDWLQKMITFVIILILQLMQLLHCKWAPWKLCGSSGDCIIATLGKCQHKGRAQRFCTGSCIQSVTTLIRIRYRLYFRQITWFDGEKRNADWVASAWKSIRSICSTVITTNLEEKCFQASKCVRMRNSRVQMPIPPCRFPLGRISQHCQTYDEGVCSC